MKTDTLLPALFAVILLGCTKPEQSSQKNSALTIPDFPKSITGMVKYYYEHEANLKFPETLMYDRYAFFSNHYEEIARTLQVKDSIVTEKIAVALYTYSVGSITYNGRLWLRNVDGNWRVASSQYMSAYSDDPFEDGMPQRAKEMIKKVDDWRKTNKGAWWEF